ncbi:DUF58 domain-containing protein [Actinomyces oris]|uniref:DUF58 domain-containing protein n=1 Tax=Actinomyces TaxID=1654 RepID=UPI000807151A|nr:DUF58 domain-containing protein [Actinomyces oris]OBY95037.1 hypothetical protein BBG13_08810 [Actinomyces oris]
MFLTMRAVWAMLAGIALVLIVPRPTTVLAWAGVVTVLVVIDVVSAPSPAVLRASRSVSHGVRLGESITATLTLTNTGRRTARLLLRDAWPPSAGATHERGAMTLPPAQRRRHSTVLTPRRRGERRAGPLTVRVIGPLGIAGRQASLDVPASVRVLPAFRSRRHLHSRLARLREMDGRSSVMVRGEGTEFDSLREYVVGDDVRSIDWRSTARRGEVLVRTWRPERDRRVLIIIDSGRLSAARLGDAPRLDAQIEATLLLAALASRAGDRVDVLAMDDAVRAQVRGSAGPVLMTELAEHLTNVEPRLTELDWTLVASLVRTTLSQRALVVVISALDGSAGDATMIRTLAALAQEHTVILASALDPELEELRSTHDDTDSVYVAASAEKDLVEMHAVRRRLSRGGVEVVEAPDQGLAPALADCYLDLKAAGRL